MNINSNVLLAGSALVLLQFLLAIPWVYISLLSREDQESLAKNPFQGWVFQRIAVILAISLALPLLLTTFVQERGTLEIAGRMYAAFLQIQLTIGFFIICFFILLKVWPKGAAVGLASFLEGLRQWMFWLLVLLACLAMVVSIFVPYFTFGEDYLMVKQLGYDTIMLAAVLFGGLAASLSISEEIEGKTAITVMSKPISRRQFMLGKYLGIILAALFMFGMLGVFFESVLLVKHWWDKLEPISEVVESEISQARIGVVATPIWVNKMIQSWGFPGFFSDFLRGIGQWLAHSLDTLPGLVLCFSQVMVLVALAVALATRVPMVVNMTTLLVVFFLSHLTPVLVTIAKKSQQTQPGPVSQILGFVSGVFDTILPDLSSFSMDPALLSDSAPPAGLFAQYLASVTLYGVVYTSIVLLFGLILFEDRDLA